jgi:hypothetical protein
MTGGPTRTDPLSSNSLLFQEDSDFGSHYVAGTYVLAILMLLKCVLALVALAGAYTRILEIVYWPPISRLVRVP